jgi:hypothetical protein
MESKMAGARELPLIKKPGSKKKVKAGGSLEEKAKARRAEAFKSYSGATKGLHDVLRALKARRDERRKGKTATLRRNPMTTGTYGRYAGAAKAGK